jgi:hypothetical protein
MAIAAAVVSCVAATGKLLAQSPPIAPNVTYTASGIFASPQVSGADTFQLAGEPFSISVVANAASIPKTHGLVWAQYVGLNMTGEVISGLLPRQPYPIASYHTSIELATGNPDYDVWAIFAPVSVIGAEVNVLAIIQMPPGTIHNALIHPFAAAATLSPSSATVTYSDGTASTTLAIQSGTANATIPSPAAQPNAGVRLHAEGALAVTSHGDGTASVQTAYDSPVDLGAQGEVVSLVFYASGVRGASEVRVQIAGRDAPILYAGPADRFPGLDEVNVQVPRSLAGIGVTDVVLIVDGQRSNPVPIRIQ